MIPPNVRGLAELNRAMEKLTKEEATKAGQVAARAGAAVLRKAAIANAPNSPKTTEGEVRTRHNKGGTTRKEVHRKIVNHIKVKKLKASQNGEVKYSVDVFSYHSTFVEFGSIHNSADPFMLRAYQDSEDSMIETIAKVLNKQLVKRGV